MAPARGNGADKCVMGRSRRRRAARNSSNLTEGPPADNEEYNIRDMERAAETSEAGPIQATTTLAQERTVDVNAKDPAVEGGSSDIASSDILHVSSAFSGTASCSVTLATVVEMPGPHEEGPGSVLRGRLAAKLGVDRTRVLLFANSLPIGDFGFIDLRNPSFQPVQYALMDEHDGDSDPSEGVVVRPNSLQRQLKEHGRYERLSMLLPRCNRPNTE